MKIKFKSQPYQTAAVKAVVDCFESQPDTSGQVYHIDPGRRIQGRMDEDGFRNADIALTQAQVLENIRKVQKCQNLPLSESLGACVKEIYLRNRVFHNFPMIFYIFRNSI